MPFLSIIIPVYNKEQYLNKCIQSIVDQSFIEWEIILINDGSTDGSNIICDYWAKTDSRIKVLHQRNAGASAARNNGLSLVSGKYVQFTDADDWWETNSFLNFHKQIVDLAYPEVIMFGITKVYSNNHTKIIKPRRLGKLTRKSLSQHILEEQRETGIYGFVSNKLISIDVIRRNNIRFDEKLNLLEDYNFHLDIFNNISEIHFSDNCGYHYLQNADNSTSDDTFKFYYPDVIAVKYKALRFSQFYQSNLSSIKLAEIEISQHIFSMLETATPLTCENLKHLYYTTERQTKHNLTIHITYNTINSIIVSILTKYRLFYSLYIYIYIKRLCKKINR